MSLLRDFDGTKYLVLFGPEKYDTIFDSIKYLLGSKRIITHVLSHNYVRNKIDSDNDLSLEKSFTKHNVKI